MDYLVHHGIKGQKWGIRRYQNSDGSLTEAGKKRYAVPEVKVHGQYNGIKNNRDASRRLNKLDSLLAQQKYTRDKYSNTIDRITSRNIKKQIDPNSKRGLKDQDKLARIGAKNKGYSNAIASNEELTNRILKDAQDRGYTVSSKQTKRYVQDGSTVAATVLLNIGGIALGALTGVGVYGSVGKRVEGTQYKVKRQK